MAKARFERLKPHRKRRPVASPANMFGYINTLRFMSSGRANFTMQFDHYDPVPRNISEEIQSQYA